METLFYLSSIVLILTELNWIINPIDQTNKAKEFSELSKQNKSKKWDEYSGEYKSILKSKMIHIYILFWLLIGVFTSQWIAFLLILTFNMAVIAPLSKLTRFSMLYTVIHWINSIIGLLFALFIIINKYHLKIDLSTYFFNLIN